MKVTRGKKAFTSVIIELETEKELACVKAVAEAAPSWTQNEAANHAGIKQNDLYNFLLDLYHELEEDC